MVPVDLSVPMRSLTANAPAPPARAVGAPPRAAHAGRCARACVAIALLAWGTAALGAPKCTLGAAPNLVFTGFTPFGTGVAATSTIAYRCPQPIARAWVVIAGPRVMTGAAGSLALGLYGAPYPGPEWGAAAVVEVPALTSGSLVVHGFLPPQEAAAGSYQATFTVSIYTDSEANWTDGTSLVATAGVADSCVIDPAALAFGDYAPVGANAVSPRDAQATIRVACTRNTAYSIGLDPGSFPSGSDRYMANGAQRLRYELYTDAGRSTVWSTTTKVSATAASTARASHVVHGRIPGGQAVGAGAYADVVRTTIDF